MASAVRPLGSLSMARGCARIDAGPDTAKIGSADRVQVHHARLIAVIGVRKTFPHGLGHVWTAPWQELSDVFAALVGCGHVSGLLMRQVWPLALMLCADRVPIVRMHLKVR